MSKKEEREEIERAMAEFKGKVEQLPDQVPITYPGWGKGQTRYSFSQGGFGILGKVSKHGMQSPYTRKSSHTQSKKCTEKTGWQKYHQNLAIEKALRHKLVNAAKRKERLTTI